jgi:dihydroneopterin aldolase
MTYSITIKDLHAHTILGVEAWEQQAPRLVVLNISLEVDAPKAATTDDIADSVDYATLESAILTHLNKNSFKLIERLANELCQLILSLDPRIEYVSVEADKPGALRQAYSVSVTAEATR